MIFIAVSISDSKRFSSSSRSSWRRNEIDASSSRRKGATDVDVIAPVRLGCFGGWHGKIASSRRKAHHGRPAEAKVRPARRVQKPGRTASGTRTSFRVMAHNNRFSVRQGPLRALSFAAPYLLPEPAQRRALAVGPPHLGTAPALSPRSRVFGHGAGPAGCARLGSRPPRGWILRTPARRRSVADLPAPFFDRTRPGPPWQWNLTAARRPGCRPGLGSQEGSHGRAILLGANRTAAPDSQKSVTRTPGWRHRSAAGELRPSLPCRPRRADSEPGRRNNVLPGGGDVSGSPTPPAVACAGRANAARGRPSVPPAGGARRRRRRRFGSLPRRPAGDPFVDGPVSPTPSRHGLGMTTFWVGTSQRSMATPLPSPLICPVQVDVTRKIVTILKLIAVKVRGYAFSGYPPPPRRRRGAAPLGFPAAAL